MLKLAQNGDSKRRNFKLSALEMLIIGLIILGVLYLVSLWMTSFLSPAPQTQNGGVSLAQIEPMLDTVKKAERRLAVLEKTVKELRERVAKSGSSSASGKAVKADPAVSGRLAALEEKVKGLSQPAASSQLEGRLKAMEKKVRAQSTIEKRVQDLEKSSSHQQKTRDKRLDKLEKSLSNLEDAPEAALSTLAALEIRVKRIEAAMIKARQSSGKAQAVLNDPELAARVGKLEKKVADSDVQKRVTELRRKVNDLSGKLANLEKEPPQETQAKTAKATPPPEKTTKPPEPKATTHKAAPSSKGKVVKHKVRRGDTLFALARRYKVTAADIRQWNPKLKKRRYLWVGEILIIRVGQTS
jgi:LysM repeat protein